MKGVSTLVVVILLLLITVSLIGFVFIFFQRSTAGAAEQTTQQQEQLQSNLGKQVRIDNAASTNVLIRHVGTVNIALVTEATAFINNVQVTCTWNPATLTPGSTSVCTYAGAVPPTCAPGATVKIITPAGPATGTC